MEGYEGPNTALTIALHGSLQLAIVMEGYEVPLTAFNIALH
jgi:hypothetical protein